MWKERARRASYHASALLRDLWDLVAQRFGRTIPPLTRTEIIWAYRSILDREPVNEVEIDARRNDCASVPHMRWHMVGTDAYRAKNPPLHLPALMGDEPPMVIEEVQDPQELQMLINHVQTAWQYLGETEPYWSVVTGEQYLMANIEKSREEFYRMGQTDVARLLRTFERNGVDAGALRTCLEYGCGLGRVTRWLAPLFDSLYACDISQPHLHTVEQYLCREQLNNVVLKQIQSVEDLRQLPKVDLVYSIIVLQHNPPPVIAVLLDHLLRALNPGGYAYFQVPTYRKDYRFTLADYLQNEAQRQDMEMHLLPQNMIFELIQRNGAQLIEVLEDAHTGLRYKERSNSFLVRKLPNHEQPPA